MSIKRLRAVGLAAAGAIMLCSALSALGQDKKPEAKPVGAAMPRPESKAGSGPEISLKPGYAKGGELKFVQQIVRTDQMKVPSVGEQIVRYDATIHSIVRVVKADAEGTELEMRISSIKAQVGQGMKSEKEGEAGEGGANEVYDSATESPEAPAKGPVANAFKPLVGLPLTIRLDAKGAIASVSGGEVVSLPRGSMSQVPQMLITTEGVKAVWGPVLCLKPDGLPARVGQVWVNEEKRAAGAVGTITFTSASTLKSADADQAVVAVEGTMDLKPTTEGESMAMKLSDGAASGKCIWDLKAGAAKSVEWRQRSSISGSAQGISTERSSDWTATTKRE